MKLKQPSDQEIFGSILCGPPVLLTCIIFWSTPGFTLTQYLITAGLTFVLMELLFAGACRIFRKELTNTGIGHTIIYKYWSLMGSAALSPFLVWLWISWKYTWNYILVFIRTAGLIISYIIGVLFCIAILILIGYVWIILNDKLKNRLVKGK